MLPNDPRRIEPGAIVEWISRHVSDDAEAVFIGGTGFRAARAIETLEERLGRPVLESNQVLLWSILAHGRTPTSRSAGMAGCSIAMSSRRRPICTTSINAPRRTT